MSKVDSWKIEFLENGVVIPEGTIADSIEKKKKKGKTLAQLPVYRDASNLKYIITALMMNAQG